MLQRLELIGFKSFADKTRFDFAPGITAVVGPNGSGKSNIVDAVKWVLGEQSAKSLRGGEMADVIFNGSSTRKALGMAEVSMTFDNRERILDSDAAEVRITRRVYRDGQGEYLINGQASRLRDIKDLFLGSGAGHGAYSVIEQGRVDALLTASTTDRRVLFEEAAGISRFKAKKVETLRKLERVDADLTRVRDILQELEKQLRTLRLQAAKAQRYQDYSIRLKDLRVGLGLQEYRDLADTLNREEAVLVTARAEVARFAGQEQGGEDRLRNLDGLIAGVEGALREHHAVLAEARQRIAGREAEARSERGQAERLASEVLRFGKQRAEAGSRLSRIASQLSTTTEELKSIESQATVEQGRAAAATAALADVVRRIDALTRSSQSDRTRQFELARMTAKLQSETETLRREADRLKRELNSKLIEVDRTTQRHDALATALEHLTRSDADVQQKLMDARRNLAEHISFRDELEAKADAIQLELERQREERSSLRGRADVLEGLQRSQEGIGSGVREVLRRLSEKDPALQGVIGLVADFLTAPREFAPLIDLALGESAQQFVVSDSSQLDDIVRTLTDLSGRVGLIPLGPDFGIRPVDDLEGVGDRPLVASRLVTVENPLVANLPHQLLGDVFIVPDLSTARSYQARTSRERYITRAGEVLEPDGSVTVGPTGGGTGILSRKSELRELHEAIRHQDEQIESGERRQAAYRQKAEEMGAPVQSLETEIAALGGEAGNLQSQIRDQRLEQARLADLIQLAHGEARRFEADLRAVEADMHARLVEWEQSERTELEVKSRLAEAEVALSVAQQERDQRQAENTAAQVALGRVTAQLAGVRKERDELEGEFNQRRMEANTLAVNERSARSRMTESELVVLRAGEAAAEAYVLKESAEQAARILTVDRDRLRAERDTLQSEVKRHREAWTRHRDHAHAHEMLVRDLTHRRDTLTARLLEDYGVNLADLANSTTPTPEPDSSPDSESRSPHLFLDPDAVQEEIDELRKKITKLGSVNLEALEELVDVEKREADLRTQHDDLADSQGKLIEIINRINTDSRKLFVETLNTVREHFQELFRKLFGGGMADVVLENDADPLESGIEVTARPPGKELRSISLLSGGERTLTAVALLLAIFRSRPSPFCLLDEVDAALDEANTARLGDVLREFLDRSQFIIVTHKKRTMSIADVIFGVTMQESGVSKQVSVRFDDWPDEPQEAA